MVDMYKIVEGLCRRNGISVAELCRGSGVPQSTITELKHGRTKSLSHKNILRICEYFDISTDVFNEDTYSETVMNRADFDSYFGKEKAPALTKKDERDIEKRLEAMIGDLEGNADGLMFSGEPMDEETRELLKMSLRNQLEISKRLAKQKSTPKKYRKEGE